MFNRRPFVLQSDAVLVGVLWLRSAWAVIITARAAGCRDLMPLASASSLTLSLRVSP